MTTFRIAVLLGVVALAGAATAAPAQAAEPSTLSWSVRPTPTTANPERPNFAFDATPGGTIKDSIRVRNYDKSALALDLYASDAITTSSGALDLLPAGTKPTDVGVWIDLDSDHIVVPASGFLDIPFTMTVPANAEPGDHTGGIVTSYRQPGTTSGGDPVVLDRRLGNRVHVRVAGATTPGLTVSDLSVSYGGTWNPFGPGKVHVEYTVTNTGNVRVAADQSVTAKGLFGLGGQTASVKAMPELLPGSSLHFAADITGVWPTFATSTEVDLSLTPTRPGDSFDGVTASDARTTMSLPWPQLLVLLLLVAAVLAWRWNRRRRRRREAALVDEAVRTALAGRENDTSDADATPADIPHDARR